MVAAIKSTKRGKHEVLGNPTVFKEHSDGSFGIVVEKKEVKEEPQENQDEMKDKLLIEIDKAKLHAQAVSENVDKKDKNLKEAMEAMEEKEKIIKAQKHLSVEKSRKKKADELVVKLTGFSEEVKMGNITEFQAYLTEERKKKDRLNERKQFLNLKANRLLTKSPEHLTDKEKEIVQTLKKKAEDRKAKFSNRDEATKKKTKEQMAIYYRRNAKSLIQKNIKRRKEKGKGKGKGQGTGTGQGTGGSAERSEGEDEDEDDPAEEGEDEERMRRGEDVDDPAPAPAPAPAPIKKEVESEDEEKPEPILLRNPMTWLKKEEIENHDDKNIVKMEVVSEDEEETHDYHQ